MQPSSLMLVAIIAIWAAFLIQHWVRRREHLATVRSVDRFSEAMRVLDRRRPVVAAPTVRSYVVSPVRPQAGEASRGTTSPATSSEAAVPAVENTPAPPSSSRKADGSTAVPSRAALPSRTAVPSRPAVRVGSRAMRILAGTTLRRVRAVTLLVLLVALPVTLLVALLRPLLWAAPVIAIGLLTADLAWLRHAARAARRARAAARVRQVRSAEAAAGLPEAAPAAPLQPTSPGLAQVAEQPAKVAGASTASSSLSAAGSTPVTAASAEVAARPGSWAPVPVPPPTYTLKAKAPEPARRELEVPAVPVAPSSRARVGAGRDAVFDQTARVGASWSDDLDEQTADETEYAAPADDLALRRSAAG